MSDAPSGSATRAMRVLEHFAATRAPARLRDLSAALALPSSSMAELLKELSEAGFLAFDPGTRRYFPTPKVTALGDWIPDLMLKDSGVLMAARSLHETTGELIVVGVMNGLYVQYVEVLQSRHAIRYMVETGVRRLLVKSGMGWALLALDTDAGVERCYRRTASAAAGRTMPLPGLDELLGAVREVRRTGHAFSRSRLHPGASVIAATLEEGGDRRFALGVAGPTDRLEANHVFYAGCLRGVLSVG